VTLSLSDRGTRDMNVAKSIYRERAVTVNYWHGGNPNWGYSNPIRVRFYCIYRISHIHPISIASRVSLPLPHSTCRVPRLFSGEGDPEGVGLVLAGSASAPLSLGI